MRIYLTNGLSTVCRAHCQSNLYSHRFNFNNSNVSLLCDKNAPKVGLPINTPPKVDLSLIFVTRDYYQNPDAWDKVIKAAILGGVTAIQFRKPWSVNLEAGLMLTLAKRISDLVRNTNPEVAFFMNNCSDIAKAVGAHLHIGPSDFSYAAARKVVGDNVYIGYSVDNRPQLEESETYLGLNYIAMNVFGSVKTKPFHPGEVWGIEGVKEVRKSTKREIVAIGGINFERAKVLGEVGINGIAVVGAICDSTDPESAAKKLKASFLAGRAIYTERENLARKYERK